MSSTAGIFKLGINLMLVDNFTNKFGIVEAKLGKIDKWANNINDKIKGVITPMNAAFVGIGTKIMKDFAETEDATIQLRNTMMGIGGVVSKEFEAVSKKAEDLGAKLPGTTADFYKMASAMRSLGVGDKSLSSALEATAKMAVVLKSQGVSFEQASEATAKFKNALGIADNDMVSFADTVQRTAHMGVNLTEMQYAFARSAGILKVMNLQGLQSANALSPVVAMLIKSGLNLVCTPGNDVEATTGKVAAGATLILFTTGLGTPTGNPICPVIKVSSNSILANKMNDVIDINCGDIIEGTTTIQSKGIEILNYCIKAASGEIIPKTVLLNQDDFIPWKRGVSL